MSASAQARHRPRRSHGTVSRRTQQERRAQTQARLLEATMACLAEQGWAGTSTTEVARRAGVSRGAQQHHYPTKRELVAAALEDLIQRLRAGYEEAFAALPPPRRNVEGAIDLLWDTFRAAPALALMELAMAARTDASLRALSRDVNERIIEVILQTFHRLFPSALPDEAAPAMVRAVYAAMIGLTLQDALDDDASGHQAAALAQIKTWVRALIP
jgi:AcrR family transcriptional regulator